MHEVSSYTKKATNEIIGNAIAYDDSDRKIFREIYKKWEDLNSQISTIKGRKMIFPLDLVEGIICLDCNMWKVTNGMTLRYNLWDPNNEEGKNRILIQATTSAVVHMLISPILKTEIDRIFFTKLYIATDSPLEYTIYDFDIDKIMELYHGTGNPSRTYINYDELEKIPYNQIIKGKL
jgi:hypothetical protein